MKNGKGTLRFNGIDCYVNVGDVERYRAGLQRSSLKVWIKSASGEGVECVFGMVHKKVVICAVYLEGNAEGQSEPGISTFVIRDADGRTLAGTTCVPLRDWMWHQLEWVVTDSASNAMKVFLDDQQLKLNFTHSEGPFNFSPIRHTPMKSFFPSETIIGAISSVVHTNEVLCFFKGWAKYLSLFVDEELAYRWPMDVGTGSSLVEIVHNSKASAASNHKCQWDKLEGPPTSVHFDGITSMGLLGPHGLGKSPWEVCFWIKTNQQIPSSPLEVRETNACCVIAEILLNTPSKGETTFTLTDGARRRLTAVINSPICDGKWHEISWGVHDSANNKMEVSIDSVRVSMLLTHTEGPSDLFYLTTTAVIPPRFEGYVRHLVITSEGGIITDLLMDEGIGDCCLNTVPGASNGMLSSQHTWHPTVCPPLVLWIGDHSYVEAGLYLSSEPDFSVQFLINVHSTHKSLYHLMSGSGVGWSFVIELQAETAVLTVVEECEGELLAKKTTRTAEAVVCDTTWHKIKWTVAGSKWSVLLDSVPVGVSAPQTERVEAAFAPTLSVGNRPNKMHQLNAFILDVQIYEAGRLSAHLPLCERFGESFISLPRGERAVVKNVTWKSTAVPTSALLMDNDCCVDIGDTRPHFKPSNFEAFTFECWIKCGSTTRYQVLWAANDPTSPNLEAAVCLSLNCCERGLIGMVVRDSCGRILHGHCDTSVFDVEWHNIEWEVESAASGVMKMKIDSKPVRVTLCSSQGPRVYDSVPDFIVTIGAMRREFFTDHHYEGIIAHVALSHSGKVIASWPMEGGTTCVAADEGENALIGTISNPNWVHTAVPPCTLQLCGKRSTLTTLLHAVADDVEFWITPSREPGVLFTLTSDDGSSTLWNVEINMTPCAVSVGMLTITVMNAVVAVVDAGQALFSGLWHMLQFSYNYKESCVQVKMNNRNLAVTYFKKDSISLPCGRSVFTFGGMEGSLKAGLRSVKVRNADKELLNIPLEQSLQDISGNRCVSAVNNFKWEIKALPPSVLVFNGINTHANLGNVGSFGALLSQPWQVSLRVRCCSPEGEVQALLSCIDDNAQFVVVMHMTTQKRYMAWYLTVFVSDHDGCIFVVSFHVPRLSDNKWHALRIQASNVSTNELQLLVDGENMVPEYGECDSPANFSEWKVPLFLGASCCNAELRSYFKGCIRDVVFESDASVIAKWSLRTGYDTVTGDSSGGMHHGSLMSASWESDAALCEPEESSAVPLRDIQGECSIQVSRWCEGTYRSNATIASGGGVVIPDRLGSDGWSSGASAPQWMHIDLQRCVNIYAIELLTRCDMLDNEACQTVHQIWTGGDTVPTHMVHEFKLQPKDGIRWCLKLEHPLPAVRCLRILTTQSQCTIGWRKVKIMVLKNVKKVRQRAATHNMESLSRYEHPLFLESATSIRGLFNRLDVLRCGHVEKKDVASLYREYEIGLRLPDKQLDQMISKYSKKGVVSFDGFSVIALGMTHW